MQPHQFWDFSLDIYRKPGVADACLFVQDRYGLNVNFVLFCVWVADCGSGALSTADIATAMRRIMDWEKHIVRPLREIRRLCRQEPLGVPEFLLQTFHPRIETAELEAEHVEQLVLAEFARSLPVATPEVTSEVNDRPTDSVSDAVCSLKSYIGTLDVDQDAQLTECLTVILRAVFPGVCFPGAYPAGVEDG